MRKKLIISLILVSFVALVITALAAAGVHFPVPMSWGDPGGGGGNPCAGNSCLYQDASGCWWQVINSVWTLLTCN